MTDNEIIVDGLNSLKGEIDRACRVLQGDDKAELFSLRDRIDSLIKSHSGKQECDITLIQEGDTPPPQRYSQRNKNLYRAPVAAAKVPSSDV